MIDPTKVKIGDTVLRKGTQEPPHWTYTYVNDTYLNLIREFPEDYKSVSLSEHVLFRVFGFVPKICNN